MPYAGSVMNARDALDLGSKPAPGELAFVQGFVNTVDLETGLDRLSTPDGLAQWLVRHGLIAADEASAVGEAERTRAVEVREALRALLLAHNGEPLEPGSLDPLRAPAAGEGVRVEPGEDGSLRLAPVAAGVAGALSKLLAVAAHASAEGTWQRLKACRSHDCAWAFYDATKNRSGAWCTMEACGSREKARAYRARRART